MEHGIAHRAAPAAPAVSWEKLNRNYNHRITGKKSKRIRGFKTSKGIQGVRDVPYQRGGCWWQCGGEPRTTTPKLACGSGGAQPELGQNV